MKSFDLFFLEMIYTLILNVTFWSWCCKPTTTDSSVQVKQTATMRIKKKNAPSLAREKDFDVHTKERWMITRFVSLWRERENTSTSTSRVRKTHWVVVIWSSRSIMKSLRNSWRQRFNTRSKLWLSLKNRKGRWEYKNMKKAQTESKYFKMSERFWMIIPWKHKNGKWLAWWLQITYKWLKYWLQHVV